MATAQFILGTVLWPEAYVATMNSWWQANNGFVQAVNSCPTFGVNPGFIQEGQCYWAKFDGRRSDWNTTATNIGGQDETYSFSGGIQVALRDEWRLGFAGSYQNSTIKTSDERDNRLRQDGRRHRAQEPLGQAQRLRHRLRGLRLGRHRAHHVRPHWQCRE